MTNISDPTLQPIRPHSAGISHVSKTSHQLYLQTLQEARYSDKSRPGSAAKKRNLGTPLSPLKPVPVQTSLPVERYRVEFGPSKLQQQSFSPKRAEEQLKEEVRLFLPVLAQPPNSQG